MSVFIPATGIPNNAGLDSEDPVRCKSLFDTKFILAKFECCSFGDTADL